MLPKNFKGRDLTGQKFGQWTVLGFLGKDKHGNTLWNAFCVCGKTGTPFGHDLIKAGSLGCRSCQSAKANFTHGHATSFFKSGAYRSWSKLKERCLDKNHRSYHHYGGRGIKICARWLEPRKGFLNFLDDMGERPEGTSIDRINNDGNYEPENCRWATVSQQNSNQRPRKRRSNAKRGKK